MIEGSVTRRSVADAIARHARPGRHGIGALRAAYDSVGDRRQAAGQRAGAGDGRLLIERGLPPAVFHPIVLGFGAGLRLPRPSRWPSSATAGRATASIGISSSGIWRAMQSSTAAGWVVLRFSWRQITRRPDWVADTIRRTLLTRSAA